MNISDRVLGVAKHALCQRGFKAQVRGEVLAVSGVGFFGAPRTCAGRVSTWPMRFRPSSTGSRSGSTTVRRSGSLPRRKFRTRLSSEMKSFHFGTYFFA